MSDSLPDFQPDFTSIPAAAREFWQLPPAELDRLLALSGQVDHVEVKLVVPETAHASTCAALGVDLTRAPVRKVYFLDTPDLALERHGVVVRLRSIEHKPDDSVIKLRPFPPGKLPARRRRRHPLVIEIDVLPGRYLCTGALRHHLGRHEVERALAEGRPLRALFSGAQLVALAMYAPPALEIDTLAILGPVDVRRGKVLPAGLSRGLTVEQWTYPDGSRVLELSTRCPGEAALPVIAHVASVLRAYRIRVEGLQETKTRTTLSYFTGR